jgi:hypothetical protein
MWSDGCGGRWLSRDAGRRTGTAAVGEILATEAAHAGAARPVSTGVAAAAVVAHAESPAVEALWSDESAAPAGDEAAKVQW